MEYCLFYYNKNSTSFLLLKKSNDFKLLFDELERLNKKYIDKDFVIFQVLSDRGGVCL